MAPWSANEVAALLASWRDTLEAPTHLVKNSSVYMYEQFVRHCGGATERKAQSLLFKRETMRNMVTIVHAYNARKRSTSGDGLPWFALSARKKRAVFEARNKLSYGYVELDVETFTALGPLVKQAERRKRERALQCSQSPERTDSVQQQQSVSTREHPDKVRAAVELAAMLASASVGSMWGVTKPEPTASSVHTDTIIPEVSSVATSVSGNGATGFEKVTTADDDGGVMRATTALDLEAPEGGERSTAEMTAVSFEADAQSQQREQPVVGGDGDGVDGSSTESDSDVGHWGDSGDSDDEREATWSPRQNNTQSLEGTKPVTTSSESNGDDVTPRAEVVVSASVEVEPAHDTERGSHNTAPPANEPLSPASSAAVVVDRAPPVEVAPVTTSSGVTTATAEHGLSVPPQAAADSRPDVDTERLLESNRELFAVVSMLEDQRRRLKDMLAEAKSNAAREQRVRLRDRKNIKSLARAVRTLAAKLEASRQQQRADRELRESLESARLDAHRQALEDARRQAIDDERRRASDEHVALAARFDAQLTASVVSAAAQTCEIAALKREIAKLQGDARLRSEQVAALLARQAQTFEVNQTMALEHAQMASQSETIVPRPVKVVASSTPAIIPSSNNRATASEPDKAVTASTPLREREPPLTSVASSSTTTAAPQATSAQPSPDVLSDAAPAISDSNSSTVVVDTFTPAKANRRKAQAPRRRTAVSFVIGGRTAEVQAKLDRYRAEQAAAAQQRDMQGSEVALTAGDLASQGYSSDAWSHDSDVEQASQTSGRVERSVAGNQDVPVEPRDVGSHEPPFASPAPAPSVASPTPAPPATSPPSEPPASVDKVSKTATPQQIASASTSSRKRPQKRKRGTTTELASSSGVAMLEEKAAALIKSSTTAVATDAQNPDVVSRKHQPDASQAFESPPRQLSDSEAATSISTPTPVVSSAPEPVLKKSKKERQSHKTVGKQVAPRTALDKKAPDCSDSVLSATTQTLVSSAEFENNSRGFEALDSKSRETNGKTLDVATVASSVHPTTAVSTHSNKNATMQLRVSLRKLPATQTTKTKSAAPRTEYEIRPSRSKTVRSGSASASASVSTEAERDVGELTARAAQRRPPVAQSALASVLKSKKATSALQPVGPSERSRSHSKLKSAPPVVLSPVSKLDAADVMPTSKKQTVRVSNENKPVNAFKTPSAKAKASAKLPAAPPKSLKATATTTAASSSAPPPLVATAYRTRSSRRQQSKAA